MPSANGRPMMRWGSKSIVVLNASSNIDFGQVSPIPIHLRTWRSIHIGGSLKPESLWSNDSQTGWNIVESFGRVCIPEPLPNERGHFHGGRLAGVLESHCDVKFLVQFRFGRQSKARWKEPWPFIQMRGGDGSIQGGLTLSYAGLEGLPILIQRLTKFRPIFGQCHSEGGLIGGKRRFVVRDGLFQMALNKISSGNNLPCLLSSTTHFSPLQYGSKGNHHRKESYRLIRPLGVFPPSTNMWKWIQLASGSLIFALGFLCLLVSMRLVEVEVGWGISAAIISILLIVLGAG